MPDKSGSTFVRKPNPVDVVVVGLGATGGTAAKVLSEAGLGVVGLDRGPWLRPREHFSGDELKFVSRNYLGPDPDLAPRTVREDEQSRSMVAQFSANPQLVGGGTTHWCGWFPRPMRSDFIQRTLHGDIAGASIADWPIRYEDLEPYLTKVEWEFGVMGLPEANKYEPPRSKGYPCPPLPPTAFGKKFYEGCAKLGINAYPLPQAAVSTSHKGRDPSNWTGFYNEYGDPTTTKSTTLTSFIPEALATGRFDLRPNCYVTEVRVGADGLAKSVIYFDPYGNEVEQEAQVVVLSLGAIESARLLLLSASNSFPQGLANSSGMVGKNATFHGYLYAVGLFDKDLHDPLYGFTGNYISGGSLEFYETDTRRGHIGGCLIAATQVGHPIHWDLPGRPLWGSAAKDADRDFFNHAMKIGVVLQDLPVESNRVDLDPEVKDAWGLPVARITHKSHINDVKLSKWQVDKNLEILEAAGAWKTIPVYLQSFNASFHQHGTARMGTDASRTVLNEWCQAHDIQNLFVLDGSCFPTASGVNPTLTMMANAWRSCEYIVDAHAKGGCEQVKMAGRHHHPKSRSGDGPARSQADWGTRRTPLPSTSGGRLFFREDEWSSIEAAVARIIPTDHDPGALEADVVRFIDRYLSGVDFIYAAADGSGFLTLDGSASRTWTKRISAMQRQYRLGITILEDISQQQFGSPFRTLEPAEQDRVLEVLSGAPKPKRIQQHDSLEDDIDSRNDWRDSPSIEGRDFFRSLASHARQGFYSDPIYGGNRDGVGWKVIGFPGPKSVAETNNLKYNLKEYLVLEYDWPSLIPYLRSHGKDQSRQQPT